MLKLHYTTQTWANWVMVAILAIAVISTTAGIFSTNTASAEARNCPWEVSGQNGGVIIHFPEKTLYSSRTESDSKIDPVDTNITAGTWRVGLTSYDPHSTKANPYQPLEQWFLRLNYAQGGYVDTAAIADLPDNVDTLSQVVNTDLAVTSEVTSVTAMHAFYPEKSSPNSISPVCVLLEKVVVTPTPTPTPSVTSTPSPTPTATPTPSSTPDNDDDNDDDDGDEEPAALSISKTDHKDMTRPGHTLTYEIQVKNTGEGTIDDLVIQDSLPGAVTLEQVSSNPEVNGKTIIWGNTALAGGETLTYFVTVKVNQDADNGQTLVNAVKAKSEDKGISASDTDTTVVEKIGQIGAAKTEQPVAVPVTAKTGAGTTSALAIVTGATGLLASLLRRRIG